LPMESAILVMIENLAMAPGNVTAAQSMAASSSRERVGSALTVEAPALHMLRCLTDWALRMFQRLIVSACAGVRHGLQFETFVRRALLSPVILRPNFFAGVSALLASQFVFEVLPAQNCLLLNYSKRAPTRADFVKC
jgi:hypothetical protein